MLFLLLCVVRRVLFLCAYITVFFRIQVRV